MAEKVQKDMLRYVAEWVRLNRECLEITRRLLAGSPWPDFDLLTEGLEERGRLIARAREIERALPTRKSGERVVLEGVSEDQREALAEKLGELRQAAEALAEQDRLLGSEVRRLASEVGGELKKFRNGHTVLKAYSPYKAPQNFLIDKKG